MPFFNRYFTTRRWLKVGLAVAGFVAGAAFGLVLTRIGKIAAGAPPATVANYLWNAAVFGVLATIVSPLVSWNALRQAPLWRTVAEPLGYAIVGGAAALVVGAPVFVLILPPVGLAVGFVRLHHRYPERTAWPELPPSEEL
ncbi:MAG: hypothetical protein ACYC0B_09435 [Gemmatimonadaceae bacterium]